MHSIPTYPDCDYEKRVVRVGGVDARRLLAQLEVAGVLLNEHARSLFASTRLVTAEAPRIETTIELAVRSLGYPRGSGMAEIRRSAIALGLHPPPPELGPHLRLQYLDQAEALGSEVATKGSAPPGSITIASDPISEDDDFPKGFYLRRIQGMLWLRGFCCDAEHIWGPDDRLIFVAAPCSRARSGGLNDR